MIVIVHNPTKKLVVSVFHEVLHSRAALAIETGRPMTLKFNTVPEVVEVHAPAKFH